MRSSGTGGLGRTWMAVWAVASLAAACSSSHPVAPGPASQRFADSGTCPTAVSADLPRASGCVTSVAADLDGDGTADRFVVFGRLDGDKPTWWWAAAILASGRRTPPVRLPAGPAVGGSASVYPRVAGAAEANGEPGAEVFVQLSADLYHSAARPVDAIFGMQHGRVVPVTESGRLFTFSTDGISRFGDGARCETEGGRHLFVLQHVQIEPNGWRWTTHPLAWSGLRLEPVAGGRSGHLPAVTVGDPRVYRYYRLACGSVRLSAVTDSYPTPS